MRAITKVLVANRGEIAVRIIRSAKALGHRTVAVHSDIDANALHVRAADEAVCIGPALASESYLSGDKLIAAAKQSGADAIHPGYGFLSENADFALASERAGIIFIGPPAQAIELMGSKRRSKLAMQDAGVPCIPGYEGEDQSDARLVVEAKKIGFPLMVKASAGGGGKGMRLVNNPADLEHAIRLARSEAKKAFGNDELILEKALIEPRHIEIQVFADNYGNVVHLGERDCSIQRRHQKVVEEAPSPFVDAALRQRMGKAATEAARACSYRGAGTVEFLVDKDRNFYFLEMNTRLQVEHPVTELVTGQDLVAWQLRVAAGEPMPLSQEQIALNGHAIEVRLYAEDPRNGFLPQTGRIHFCDLPDSTGIRIDHGIAIGQLVSSHYDPLLAKIIAFGATRTEACRRLARAVEDTMLLGVKTNKSFLARILRHHVFIAGKATTAFIESDLANDASLQPGQPGAAELGMAAFLLLDRAIQPRSRHYKLVGWRNTAPAPVKFRLHNEGIDHELGICLQRNGESISMNVDYGGARVQLDDLRVDGQTCTFAQNGVRKSVRHAFDGERLFIDGGDGSNEFTDVSHQTAPADRAGGSGRVLAPMDGVIVDVLVRAGDRVGKGQTVAVLESMKMEHQLTANIDGIVKSVDTHKGEQVKIRKLLVDIATDSDNAGQA